VRAGHLAIAEGLKHGALPWRPLGYAMTVPGISQLAGKVYTWVADHRYALPGGTPACAPKHLSEGSAAESQSSAATSESSAATSRGRSQ
jgi:predicted DCC family thiol-disulfide oxidoreductase YuxK